MKKFWIFILGVIVAIVGLHFLTKNDETIVDDNNQTQSGTVTPEDPTPTIGLPTDVTISVSDSAGMQGYSFYDVSGNLVEQLTIGETYTFILWIAPNYAASLPSVNGVEVALPYTFVADNEFNFYAQLDVVQTGVTATVSCANSSINAVFYDQAYNVVSSFEPTGLYRIELQYDSSIITIYNVKVDGVTVYQFDESGWDLTNMTFNAPDHDFVVEITTTADLFECSYTVSSTDGHFSRIDITNLGGGMQPSAIYAGTTYQLNFETHAGFYVTEVYLNDELLQTYEAGGIASGSVQFTPTGDFDLRVVTVG